MNSMSLDEYDKIQKQLWALEQMKDPNKIAYNPNTRELKCTKKAFEELQKSSSRPDWFKDLTKVILIDDQLPYIDEQITKLRKQLQGPAVITVESTSKFKEMSKENLKKEGYINYDSKRGIVYGSKETIKNILAKKPIPNFSNNPNDKPPKFIGLTDKQIDLGIFPEEEESGCSSCVIS